MCLCVCAINNLLSSAFPKATQKAAPILKQLKLPADPHVAVSTPTSRVPLGRQAADESARVQTHAWVLALDHPLGTAKGGQQLTASPPHSHGDSLQSTASQISCAGPALCPIFSGLSNAVFYVMSEAMGLLQELAIEMIREIRLHGSRRRPRFPEYIAHT